MGENPKRYGVNFGGKAGGKTGGKMARIERNRQQWTTVKWLNQQERPIQFPAHNPKVGGSNPSPAIRGGCISRLFLLGYKPSSSSLVKSGANKSGAKLAFGGKSRPERLFHEFCRLLQIIHVAIVVMLVGRRHSLVSELNRRQFETANGLRILLSAFIVENLQQSIDASIPSADVECISISRQGESDYVGNLLGGTGC